MIKAVTAYTYEIDDIKKAVGEVTSQLHEKMVPGKNMLGLVSCSLDYSESGVLEALAAALPFPVIGATTISQSVNAASGMLMLTLMVLYSDDCTFSVGVTDPLPETGDMSEVISESYKRVKAGVNEREKLILAFVPLLFNHSGDEYVNALSRLSDRVPVFGTVCSDDTRDYTNCHTFFGKERYRDRMIYALVYGNCEPEFETVSVSFEAKLPFLGEITSSTGNVLHSINDMSLPVYFESVGLAAGGKIMGGINAVPFLINFSGDDDKKQVARALFSILPDGSCVCGGEMPVGCGITLGISDKSEVTSTANTMLDQIIEKYPGRPVLIYSCMGRRLSLGGDALLELNYAVKKIPSSNVFMMAYAGGEICPTSYKDGTATNRFHNFTIVACAL